MTTHPDKISSIEIDLYEDSNTVVLTMECETADIAEVVYRSIVAALKAGTVCVGGLEVGVCKFSEEERS
jgi:uncharacterized protein (DUF342 family)